MNKRVTNRVVLLLVKYAKDVFESIFRPCCLSTEVTEQHNLIMSRYATIQLRVKCIHVGASDEQTADDQRQAVRSGNSGVDSMEGHR